MILKYIFGDDIFISYTRADAVTYAAALANHLAAKDFSCFLDQYGMPPGEQPPPAIKRALSRSSSFVLIGTQEAIASRAVAMEVEQFLKTKRIFIPIDFDRALERAPWYSMIAGAARTPESAEALANGEPSANVLNRIEKTLGFTRRNKRVRRSFIAAALVLIVLIAVSVYAAGAARKQQRATALATAEATRQQRLAEENAGKAKAQETLARDNAAKASEQERIAKDQEAKALKNAEEARQRAQQYRQELTKKQSLELSAEAANDSSSISQGLQKGIQASQLAKAAPEKIPIENAGATLKTLLHKLFAEFKVGDTLIAADSSGQKVALASPLGDAVLVNSANGSRFPLCGHQFAISNLAFSPSERNLITFSDDGVLRLWDADSKRVVGSSLVKGHHINFSIDFTPNSRNFITHSFSEAIQLWKAPSGEFVGELPNTSDHEVTFDPRNPIIVSYAYGIAFHPHEPIILWNSATGKKLWASKGERAFEFVRYVDQGRKLIGLEEPDLTSGTPSRFLVVDIGTDGRPIGDERYLRFDQVDYRLLLSSPQVGLNGIALRGTLGTLLSKKYPDLAGDYGFNELFFDPQATILLPVQGSNNKSLYLFSLPSLSNLGPLDKFENRQVRSASFSQDGSLIAIYSFSCPDNKCEESIGVWSSQSRKLLWSVKPTSLADFRFSADSKRLIVWQRDEKPPTNDLWIYDAATGSEVRDFKPEAKPITSSGSYSDKWGIVAADSHANRLVVRSEHSAYFWNVERDEYKTENLFEADEKRLENDVNIASNAKNLDELVKLAKRRSNPCANNKP